jgi:hypothetical protein
VVRVVTLYDHAATCAAEISESIPG